MKSCPKCEQENPDDARYCQQCGDAFAEAVATEMDETALWRRFIGPNADRYLERFRAFTTPAGPRFAVSWNWPAFLFGPFLWFLYRKLYLYAAVYAIGPFISFLLTGAPGAFLVWCVGAGLSANYVYYWHVKEQVERIRATAGTSTEEAARQFADAGGVQMYVVYLGAVLIALNIALGIAVLMGLIQAPDVLSVRPPPASRAP
jgi:hypothetical protein